MSGWFTGPGAFPKADPMQIVVGTVLMSPKGTRWSVIAQEHEGRGSSYLMRDDHGAAEWRSYRIVSTWTVLESPSTQT